MRYIHELAEWPNFSWDDSNLKTILTEIKELQAALNSQLSQLGFNDKNEASLRVLTQDVVKTSEIEGEHLDPALVRSSIARRLGLATAGLPQVNRNIDGIVDVVFDATKNSHSALSQERLERWHASLFPTGYGGNGMKILVGKWRDDAHGPMQVVSGMVGKEQVHFVAPSHIRLQGEMKDFLHWFEQETDLDPIFKAAIAHLYFVTIHPFDDGNGRIARAIADLALARADNMNQRFYSMSAQIRNERKEYYDILEGTQKGTLDITEWLEWFLNCLKRAIHGAQIVLKDVLLKVQIWNVLNTVEVNERQRKMINLLLDGEFFGELGASKWAKMNNCSTDTATRDLAKLVEYGVLEKRGQGKATRYDVRNEIPTHLSADILSACFDLMSTEVLNNFAKFVLQNNVKKWLLISDYHYEKQFQNDVIAITVLPAAEKLITPDEISKRLPCKLSASRVQDDVLRFLTELNHFTFVFIAEKDFRPIGKNIADVRVQLAGTVKVMKAWANASECQATIKQIEKLQEKAKSNSFNVKLFNQTVLTSVFAASIVKLISKTISVEAVAWGSDRDSSVDNWDSVARTFFNVNVGAFLQREKMEQPREVAILTEDLPPGLTGTAAQRQKKSLWFAPYVRIPDHFAAPLASANLHYSGPYRDKNEKYKRLLGLVIADNPNIAVLRLVHVQAGWGLHHIRISKTPPI